MSTKKASAQLGKNIAKLRATLGLNKEAFARELHVSSVAVMYWEKGRSPSADTYIKLAKLAEEKEPALAAWFWEQAGLDKSALRAIVPVIAQSIKKYLGQIGRGETVPVPPMQRVLTGMEGADSLPSLPFPASLIPRPLTTEYALVSDPVMQPLFELGDVLLIDTSETDLRKLEGRCVALFRPPEYGAEQRARTEQTPESIAGTEDGLFDTLHVGVFAAWLRVSPILSAGGAKRDERLVQIGFDVLNRNGVVTWLGIAAFEGSDRELARNKSYIVLGRVLGWAKPDRRK
jgi:transcriptional regulator with XRE-family HTH domain